ncbi:winged helix-turn-helix domain-containing protein [Lentzea sp. CC55]|uniref:winged helix-turn-helix domain-containing protein n=1 Tax=unclassified Lentzea TaxID=2643253 RepID=UPI0035B1C676
MARVWTPRPASTRRHGFTPQRPARRACEQQPAAVRTWLDEDCPAIEAPAKAEGAVIAWVDQCGLRSDTARPLVGPEGPYADRAGDR